MCILPIVKGKKQTIATVMQITLSNTNEHIYYMPYKLFISKFIKGNNKTKFFENTRDVNVMYSYNGSGISRINIFAYVENKHYQF